MEVEYAEISIEDSNSLDRAVQIYLEGFGDKPCVALPAQEFRSYLRRFLQATAFIPHVAVLREIKSKLILNFSVFATYKEGGVGWYLITARESRMKGLGRTMLRETIRVIRQDSISKNWDVRFFFAELEYPCSPCWWEHVGFKLLVNLRYAQPPIKCGWQEGFRLGVIPLYCPQRISGQDVLSLVKKIYQEEYRIPAFEKDEHFIRFKEDCDKMEPIELESCPYRSNLTYKHTNKFKRPTCKQPT